MTSNSMLVALLNRLGGRSDSVAASRNLVALAPGHLPLVEVEDLGLDGVRITALNVEELMARCLGEEPLAMELLATLVRDGATRAAPVPTAPASFWTTRDRRDLARQTLQWTLDHPEHDLAAQAFTVARGAADEGTA